MIKHQLSLVSRFHAGADSHVQLVPSVDIPDQVKDIRAALLKEEVLEVLEALRGDSVANLAKELADLQYVLLGTVLAFGLQDKFEEVFEAVHNSNMQKLHHKKTAGVYGKIQKGEGYVAPDIASILEGNL